MKRIIDGKIFNTETADPIESYSNGLSYRDFRNMSETLYRKKNGEFFLCGEGGPMTKYRERCCDMWSGGKNIIPITKDEAREWLERYSDVDTYIEVFGEPEE